jgi:hypothetical protein
MSNRKTGGPGRLPLLLIVMTGSALLQAAPVLKVVRSGQTGLALEKNGGFETLENGRAAGWQSAPQGCQLGAREGRGGSRALVCESPTGQGWFGASQVFQLNRATPAPLAVGGWSRAEKVSGGADNDYSLYVDVIYTDGTTLWGQTANFRCGTHDWERRELMILPEKPVRTLTLHCLFRHHAGKVWFDDVEVREVKAEGNAVLFQGVPVQPARARSGPGQTWTSFFRTGLEAEAALRLAGQGSGSGWPSLFLARDVATGSDFFGFENGVCSELGLVLQADYTPRDGGFAFQGKLSDTTGRDRAITLVFAWPCQTEGWQWGDDLRRSRALRGPGDYANQISVRCGATGTLSLYPMGAIWSASRGLALAIDMAQPAQYRIGCHAGLGLLYLAYDFGLASETERFPSGAGFRLVLYPFEPGWGFRGAWGKLMDIYPDYFRVRSKEQGLWMPFTDVSRVQGWEDFGFRYHEGNNNVPWDDAHGIRSFRYTEPMTWWMPMKKELPRSAADALRVRDELLQGKNDAQRRLAEVSRTAAMFDETGQPCLRFLDTPWCNGAVWSLNPNPWLEAAPATPPGDKPVGGEPAVAPRATGPPPGPVLNAATVHWSETIKERLYGPQAKGQLDGEYLDSLEGYVTADLNFRRDHFRRTTVPLTFSTDTRQPALFKGLAVFEFTKWISDDAHRLGKLMFANGVPYRFTFLCPWLDVLGTETDWLQGGKYRPAAITQMDLWRSLSGAKPYLLLMNTDYDKFTPDLVEQYFQRCLFYGMWPGFFSHNAADNPYWQNPKWYNRDRPLFRRYIPLVRRVAQAGWQPITHATLSNPGLLVERFGPGTDGSVLVTVFNDTSEVQEGRLRIALQTLGLGRPPAAVRELLTRQAQPADAEGWEVRLPPHEARVYELAGPSQPKPGG